MRNISCPLCRKSMFGGMTLVRHLHKMHNIDTAKANAMVDDLYDEKKMPTAPRSFEVFYEHLTASECESLKEAVKDKEQEHSWGTYGPQRDEELQHYSIARLSTQHLENILITQPQITNELAAAILMLLKKRYGAL